MSSTAEDTQNNRQFIWKTMVAGGIAGSVAKTVVAPLDRVKIHFQVRNPSFIPFIGQFTGVFRAINVTYQKQGVVGLFRGHSATLARVFPYAAINFMAYEQFKIKLGVSKDTPAWKRIISGSLAGCTAVSFTYPFDVLRARIAYTAWQEEFITQHRGIYRSAIQALWNEGKSARGWGILGFYQGYIPTILGIIPYAGTSFFTFESLKNAYTKRKGTDDIPPLLRLGFGMVAGVCAQTVTYPLDVVRRRSQIWRATTHLPPSDTFGLRDTAKLLVQMTRAGGFRELFLGLSINYLKVAPSMGISFFIYDYLKSHYILIK